MRKNIKTKKLRILLVFIFFLLLLMCNASFAKDLVGKQAQPISISKWITRQNPDLETLDGRVYLLDFWATWCGPCVRSMPEINRIHNTYKAKGLVVIGISCDKTSRKVPRFVKKHKIDYYIAMDAGTAESYDIKSYPTLIAVDSSGEIIWHGHHSNGTLIEAIETALEKAAPSVIKDIELGPFDSLRQPLNGGKKFAAAYRKVESFTKKDNKKSLVAKQIVEAINKRVSLQIIKAQEISEEDPAEAYKMLDKICSMYGGIEAIKPAKKACFKLKQYADK